MRYLRLVLNLLIIAAIVGMTLRWLNDEVARAMIDLLICSILVAVRVELTKPSQ